MIGSVNAVCTWHR